MIGFTGKTREEKGVTLYEIVALESMTLCGYTVSEGEVGGYVSERSLEGRADTWVDAHSTLIGQIIMETPQEILLTHSYAKIKKIFFSRQLTQGSNLNKPISMHIDGSTIEGIVYNVSDSTIIYNSSIHFRGLRGECLEIHNMSATFGELYFNIFKANRDIDDRENEVNIQYGEVENLSICGSHIAVVTLEGKGSVSILNSTITAREISIYCPVINDVVLEITDKIVISQHTQISFSMVFAKTMEVYDFSQIIHAELHAETIKIEDYGKIEEAYIREPIIALSRTMYRNI